VAVRLSLVAGEVQWISGKHIGGAAMVSTWGKQIYADSIDSAVRLPPNRRYRHLLDILGMRLISVAERTL